MKTKILVLDDDQSILDLFRKVFAHDEVTLFLESDYDAALQRVVNDKPNVAIFDICLPEKSGLALLEEAKKLDPGVTVIIITGYSTTQYAIDSMKLGAYDFLTKPFDINKLKQTVHKAIDCNLLNRKVRFIRERVHSVPESAGEDIMIGSAPEMVEIWKMVGKVANSDATVLIQGESGTGKELLARAIYMNSTRKQRPFLAVNCAALPETLLESEMFGHEKGAFTDAHTRRIGKFEQCNGGSLFLDEIGEMSLANQGKLLRVLENQEFERVGGNETIKVDVRVIAASNRNLAALVKEKKFRLDLYYRLRVVSFELPPLRERMEDIPLLAELFLIKFCRRYGKEIKSISTEAMEMLTSHPWEGNVRELQNAVNSAIVLCDSELLLPEHFTTIMNGNGDLAEQASFEGDDDCSAIFKDVLAPHFDAICRKYRASVFENINLGLEKALVGMAMVKCAQNQVLAAKMLGISRNTLRDRIDRFHYRRDER
jgi:DNA-binding NtrC family response regulator